MKISNVALAARLLVLTSIVLLGCARWESFRVHNYRRAGENHSVTNSVFAVSNAVVQWAGSVTNGYSLLTDQESRHSFIGLLLKDEPGIVFMLLNPQETTAAWGFSECGKQGHGAYHAVIIIRIIIAKLGATISVAIHGSQVVDRMGFDVHTGFSRGRIIDLLPCAQDELNLFHEIMINVKN